MVGTGGCIIRRDLVIGLSSLGHWMAEGLMGIGCIADLITIAVDWEDGIGEIVEGNGMLMGGSEQPDSGAE